MKSDYGANIMVHHREALILAEGEVGREDRARHARRLMVEHGVPQDLAESNITPFELRKWMGTLPRRGPRIQRGAPPPEPPPPLADGILPPVAPDRLLEDGEVLTFGSLFLKAIHCPGPTPGSTV